MCYLKPLKIKRIEKSRVTLDNGIKAYYNKKIGILHIGDTVQIFGNVIIEKINLKNEKK